MSGNKKSTVPVERSQWLRGIKPGDIVRVSSHAFNLADAGQHIGVGIVTSAGRIIAIDRVKDVAVRYKFRRSDGLQHGEMGPHMGRIDPISAGEIEGAVSDWKFATQHPLDKREASAERDARIKATTEETLALARHRKSVDAVTAKSFLHLPAGWTLPPHMLLMGEDGFVGCMRDGDELLTQYLTGVSYFASPVTECPNCSRKISIARLEK
jgi:hypothetical protein